MSTNQVEQVDLPEPCLLASELYTTGQCTHRAGMQAPLVFRSAILYARCDLIAWNNRSQDWYDL